MYQSPISIYETAMQTIMEQRENAIFAKVQDAFDVQVDKEELIRALQYDRDQYEKGYADALASIVHCKDCIYFWNNEEMYPNHCSKHGVLLKVYRDDFCSYGERKRQ